MIAMTAMLAASALYEKGDWSSLWWLPKAGTTPVPGSQVAVDDGSASHLIFVPSGSPPPRLASAGLPPWPGRVEWSE